MSRDMAVSDILKRKLALLRQALLGRLSRSLEAGSPSIESTELRRGIVFIADHELARKEQGPREQSTEGRPHRAHLGIQVR